MDVPGGGRGHQNPTWSAPLSGRARPEAPPKSLTTKPDNPVKSQIYVFHYTDPPWTPTKTTALPAR